MGGLPRFVPISQAGGLLGSGQGLDPTEQALGESLASIQQMQAQPLISDPLTGAGAALAGWASGYRGTVNPVIAQQLAIRQQDLALAQHGFQNAFGLAQLRGQTATREDALRTAEETRRDKIADNFRQIAGDMAKSDNAETRVQGGKLYAQTLRLYGQEVPPGFAEGFAERKLDKESLGNAGLLLAAGVDLPTVAKRTGLNPDVLSTVQKGIVVGDETIMKGLGLESASAIKSRVLENELKAKEILLKDLQITDPGVPKEANLVAFREFGTSFEKLDKAQQRYAAQKALQHEIDKQAAGAALPPVPTEALRVQIAQEQNVADLRTAAQLYNVDKAKIDPFIGPTFTGAPLRERVGRGLPEALTKGTRFELPQSLIDLDNALVRTRNLVLQARSGSAVSPTEGERLLQEMPDRATDNPTIFARKLALTVRNAEIVEKRMKQLMGVGGRGAVSAASVILDNPLLPPLEVKAAGPQWDERTLKDGTVEIVPRKVR